MEKCNRINVQDHQKNDLDEHWWRFERKISARNRYKKVCIHFRILSILRKIEEGAEEPVG
jgi:hypothetical protein